jgi:Sulfotransferase domain
MMATLWHAHSTLPKKSPLAMTYHHHIWADDFPNTGIESYRKHNQLVRDSAKGRQFLEYQVTQGWKPLCEFLAIEMPKEDFPRADDWAMYKEHHSEK